MLSNRGRRYLIYRIGALIILFAIYFTSDWVWIAEQLRIAVAICLELWGHEVVPSGSGGNSDILLLVDNSLLLEFVVACTYLHLTLLAIPFCWRFRRSFLQNCLMTTLVGSGIMLLNVARIAVVTHFSFYGILSWDIIHTAVDILAHLGIIIPLVLKAVSYDLGTVSQT